MGDQQEKVNKHNLGLWTQITKNIRHQCIKYTCTTQIFIFSHLRNRDDEAFLKASWNIIGCCSSTIIFRYSRATGVPLAAEFRDCWWLVLLFKPGSSSGRFRCATDNLFLLGKAQAGWEGEKWASLSSGRRGMKTSLSRENSPVSSLPFCIWKQQEQAALGVGLQLQLSGCCALNTFLVRAGGMEEGSRDE